MADGTSGGQGVAYEARMCMLFIFRGYTRGLKNFRLRYQVPESEVGRFDDIVFDEGGGNYQIFQLKHKERARQIKITSSHLFNENLNADFNLLRYVKSIIDINSKSTLKVKKAIVFTNIDFGLQKGYNHLSLAWNRKDWCKESNHIQLRSFTPDENAIFNTSNSFPNAKYYKFDNDPNLIHILKRQTEILSTELRKKIENYYSKRLQQNEDDLLKDVTEADIREALNYIVYAVGQPNYKDLESLIKDEIKDYFKLQNPNIVYALFYIEITNWCDTKEPFDGQICDDPHVIQFKNAEIFFQKHVKKVCFGEKIPTSCFTGRTRELKMIRENLEENHDLIVSQSAKISDLGGIGKTELVKQFIKEYGQSDFFGRVIWIEAESDESVKKSFKGLAEKIDIPGRETYSLATIIDQTFDYFHGLKVLFVFDNFDSNTDAAVTYSDDEEKDMVIFCRQRIRDSTTRHQPYFIYTSRNRKCLPGVPSLDLGVLTKEDANELIKKGLVVKNYTNQDVEELTKALEYFPLALQQAIAYINRQHQINSVTGGTYVIQDYIRKCVEKRTEHPQIRYENDLGEFIQTTWIVWNVTFDAIIKDQINGLNAIKVLQFMPYLYADKIDVKMFLSLFENDTTRCEEAFLLLITYSTITRIESTLYQIHHLVQKVIQRKFKEQEDDILKKVWKLINPKLYESYFEENQNWYLISDLMEKCSIDQILHYNSLATYIKNYKDLNIKFLEFLRYLHDSKLLLEAFMKDDIDKIRKLQLSQEAIKDFAKKNYKHIIKSKSNKVFKYLIDTKLLGLNDDSIVLDIISYGNFELFKYMVEKGTNLEKLFVSTNLVGDIILEISNPVLGYLEKKRTEENVLILKESLFFASLFNQESIVESLVNHRVMPDYEFHNTLEYFPIIAAATLKYTNILKLLLKAFDEPKFKDEVAKILFHLLDKKYFLDTNCFEITFKKYLELGGDINDQHEFNEQSTFLCYVTEPDRFEVGKMEIVRFLLDNGADPLLSNSRDNHAFLNVLNKRNSGKHLRDTDDKDPFTDIYNKMRLNIAPEQFMSSIRKRVFKKVLFGLTDILSDDLFENISDVNFRNHNGETLLVYFVCELKKTDYDCEKTAIYKSNVEFLLSKGIDIHARDNGGKDALYYALDIEPPIIFNCLFTKAYSVSENVLFKAIKDDKLRCVEKLLETHFKLNHIFMNGKTVLEVAFENLALKTMLLLHRKIKELNLENEEVQRIYKKAKMALVKYIKNCGDNVNFEYLDIFIEISTDVNAIDNDGNNALHYATYLKDDKTFMYLLSKGGKVLEQTLEFAIRSDKLIIVQAIIAKYGEKNYGFAEGATSMQLVTPKANEEKRECLRSLEDVFSLNLSVLTKKDANKLIKMGLSVKNYTNEDVEKLAKALQYFPLKIFLAIALINGQPVLKSMLGGRYESQDYLTKFLENREEILKNQCESYFDGFERTTFVVWNITFDAIKQDKSYGRNAFKVLQFMPYLFADKIDAKMFLSLFEYDSTRNEKVFFLLEKYAIITRIGESSFYQMHRLVQRVAQLKFKGLEKDILKQVWKLIFPKLYESYFDEKQDWSLISDLMKQTTGDQLLQYYSLATYIKNYEELNIYFLDFLRVLHDRVLLKASLDDNIFKIRKLQVSEEELKYFAQNNIKSIFTKGASNVFKYFIEHEYVELNDASIVLDTTFNGDLDLFKYMVEKGAYLDKLNLATTDLVRDIIHGESKSLKSKLISHIEYKENDLILKESLFFTSLFNRKSLVKLLINNKVAPNYVFNGFIKYAPIIAASTFNNPNILKFLLKHFGKPQSKDEVAKILFELLGYKYFIDKNCFEIALKKYLELGGDINDKHEVYAQSTFLCFATELERFDVKTEIVNLLLDSGGDPSLMNDKGDNALFNIYKKSGRYLFETDDTNPFIKMCNKMQSKITTIKFMSSIIEPLYKRSQLSETVKISENPFEKCSDIYLKNDKGETLLIYFVRKFKTDNDHIRKSIVKYLIKKEIDVNAIDNDGNNALYYATDLEDEEYFRYLLSKGCFVFEKTLEHAIKHDKLRIVQLIIPTYFMKNHCFTNGLTAIQLALNYNAKKIEWFLTHPSPQ